MESFKKEKLFIKKFAGIKDAQIDINKFNLFIGSSASGKSITIKLVYYFKDIFHEIFDTIIESEDKHYFVRKLKENFYELFPYGCWGDEDFEIQFFYNEIDYVKIEKNSKNKNIKIEFTENIQKVFKYGKRLHNKVKKEINRSDEIIYDFEINHKIRLSFYEYTKKNIGIDAGNRQIFIPAGRAFFSTLQSSIFSLLSKSKSVDPFLVKFGSFYEKIKPFILESNVVKRDMILKDFNIDKKIESILGGKYTRHKSDDLIIHKDKRRVNLTYASSGQQEILPLLLILKSFSYFNFNGLTLYIEEPEAHLFPTAQKNVVELIIGILNNLEMNNELFITTHSPYIVSTFNNLLYAGNLLEESTSLNKTKIYEIISEEYIVKPNITSAYSVEKGVFKNIIDDEVKIIDADYLDSASYLIDDEYDNLLNIEFDE